MQLEDMLREIIEEECEDYFFGVADISLAKLPVEYEEPLMAEYPNAISIGLTIPPLVPVELLEKSKSSKINYNDYIGLIHQLNVITTCLSHLLQHEGYRTLPIHIADKSDDQRIFSGFPHELVANLAGIGWIENDNLLITPEVGSKVLLGTVLTDAPLKVKDAPANNTELLEIH